MKESYSSLVGLMLSALLVLGCHEPTISEDAGSEDAATEDAGTSSETGSGEVDEGLDECPPHQHYTCDDATEPVCAKYECESDIVYGNQLDNIWTPNCVANCHGPSGQWPNLDLQAPASAALINQPSTQTGLMNLVDGVTHLPSQSYLWHKLRGTYFCPDLVDGAGFGMPSDTCQLTDTLIEAVEKWICCGACPSPEECQP